MRSGGAAESSGLGACRCHEREFSEGRVTRQKRLFSTDRSFGARLSTAICSRSAIYYFWFAHWTSRQAGDCICDVSQSHHKHNESECLMRFLVIYAHPIPSSFVSAVHESVVASLRHGGHHVDDCDLYAEAFQPILTADERQTYHDQHANGKLVAAEVERLRQCEGIIFVFPTWNYGMPAILKGYIDRVWIPGVAFEMVRGRTTGRLKHIKRFAVITTYGSPWWLNTFVFGNPNKKVFMRGLRALVAADAHLLWLAQYGMDLTGLAQRKRFLEKVTKRVQHF